MSEKQKNSTRIVTLRKHLPCGLTDAERLAKGIELARANEDIGNEESRQGDLKADMKARLTALEAEVGNLATIVRRNEEYRDVDVQEIFDYAKGNVCQVRTDTGEQIHRREMTESERQEMLPLETHE